MTDVVIHPRDKDDVRKVVAHCNKRKIPVYVYGGGSSVTLGLRPLKGGVTIVLCTHMNRVLSINEENHTAVVAAGHARPRVRGGVETTRRSSSALSGPTPAGTFLSPSSSHPWAVGS